ncbi:MAG: thiamine biosynthesis protein ThiS [Hyphomicrobiales bacterium]|nr:MAG: thiamine biosynthesis protein ThiS [Hyphomicrobiales bacterium]
MNILINGEPTTTSAETLTMLLEQNGFANTTIATAVNSTFVPQGQRETYSLKEGDQIEVLAPMQGG